MAPDSPPDSTDDPDLRERVAELEATVEAQQATIQQLLPSRRRVLQAGGLLAGGGVLGAVTADRASADVTGQVGTQQDRVDVFAGDVDANSVSTAGIDIGSSGLINRVEVGRVNVDAPAASGNDGWDSQANITSQQFSFNTTFNSEPRVIISKDLLDSTSGTAARDVVAQIEQVRTDTFNLSSYNYTTSDYSGEQIAVNYIAIHQS